VRTAIAGVFPAAWGIAVIVVIIVPGVLVAGAAAATVRWLKFRKVDRFDNPLVRKSECGVSNSGTGES